MVDRKGKESAQGEMCGRDHERRKNCTNANILQNSVLTKLLDQVIDAVLISWAFENKTKSSLNDTNVMKEPKLCCVQDCTYISQIH